MDHAEAHERLADLALEPARLAGLADDPAPEARALRDHLAACPDCRAELDSLRRLDAALRDALASGGEATAPLEFRAPAGLRRRVLASVAASADLPPAVVPVPGRGSRAAFGSLLPLGLAAALVVAIASGGLLLQRSGELEAARAELAELGTVTASLDRILADTRHAVVALRAADGAPGGTIAWDATDVVVLATTLARPKAGESYRCWVEKGGERTAVGEMSFSGSTAYWAGTLDEWGAGFEPGSRFGVSLIPAVGDPLPVLVAEFSAT